MFLAWDEAVLDGNRQDVRGLDANYAKELILFAIVLEPHLLQRIFNFVIILIIFDKAIVIFVFSLDSSYFFGSIDIVLTFFDLEIAVVFTAETLEFEYF